jgi:hypothetical protein
MTTGRSLLTKLPELALEAVMVVFAEHFADGENFLQPPGLPWGPDAFNGVVNDLDAGAIGNGSGPGRSGVASRASWGGEREKHERRQAGGRAAWKRKAWSDSGYVVSDAMKHPTSGPARIF